MRVLIGFSRCPITVSLLRARGVEAFTCDVLPAEHPWHIQDDIWSVVGGNWSWAIFHPMCTYLTCSAAWAFKDPDFARYPGAGYHQKPKPGTLVGADRRAAREGALQDVRQLLALPYPKAIENPAVSFIGTAIRSPDQIVQPYEFGDDASKATGLWLDRLPPLRLGTRLPGRRVEWPRGSGRFVERWANQTDSGQNRLPPSQDRWLKRSKTHPGIARAFTQWSEMTTDNEDIFG